MHAQRIKRDPKAHESLQCMGYGTELGGRSKALKNLVANSVFLFILVVSSRCGYFYCRIRGSRVM